jgi:rare lipoprotein A
MSKLITAVFFVVAYSYFSSPIDSAEASTRYSARVLKTHAVKHHSPANHKTTVSWYGAQFHGKRTANGEKFNMYAMTAAHRTLPLSSYVEVTNLKNNRSVIVRINDRGPFHSRRAMDLSYAAAKELGIKGTASVQIKPVTSDQS